MYKHPRNRTQQGQEQESSQDSSSHSRPTVYANSPTPTGHTTGTSAQATNPNPSADASKTGALLLQRDRISPSSSPSCDLNHRLKTNKPGFFNNRKPPSSPSSRSSLDTSSGGSQAGSIKHNKNKPRPTRVFLPVKRGRAVDSLSHHDRNSDYSPSPTFFPRHTPIPRRVTPKRACAKRVFHSPSPPPSPQPKHPGSARSLFGDSDDDTAETKLKTVPLPTYASLADTVYKPLQVSSSE